MENLTKAFKFGRGGRVAAVEDVSLEIQPGEIFGLVGESGCGKTTLARLILRLIPPDAGTVFFKGQDILKLPAAELRKLRQKIQVVFQNPYASLSPRVRVGEAVAEPLLIHNICGKKEARSRAGATLSAVGLAANDYQKFPHEFSAGQRQRVAIARAIIMNPEFLVLDEPVSALDVTVQKQVLELLLELKNSHNLTFLFITHDLKIVSHLADTLAVMHRGRLVETGATARVISQPQHEYTRSLLESVI